MTTVSASFVSFEEGMLELVCREGYLSRQQSEYEDDPETIGVEPTNGTKETQLTGDDRDNGTTLSVNQTLNARPLGHSVVLPMQQMSEDTVLD